MSDPEDRHSAPRSARRAPALALPLTAAQATPAHPDAALIELGKRQAAADARWSAASNVVDDIVDRVREQRSPMPDALCIQEEDPKLFNYLVRCDDETLTTAHVEKIRGRTFTHLVHFKPDGTTPYRDDEDFIEDPPISRRIPWPEANARAREIIEAFDSWKAATRRIGEELGLPDAEARSEQAHLENRALQNAIIALRATTLAGLIVKADLVARCHSTTATEQTKPISIGDGSTATDVRTTDALLNDLLAMARASV